MHPIPHQGMLTSACVHCCRCLSWKWMGSLTNWRNYVESHLSNTSAKFYGEITQQMLKNSHFPGSNNGTGLFQTICGLKLREVYENIVQEVSSGISSALACRYPVPSCMTLLHAPGRNSCGSTGHCVMQTWLSTSGMWDVCAAECEA